MSLHDITAAANDLAALLESTAPKGLRHPRHANSIRPARKKIERVMRNYFERQKSHVLHDVKPRIERELMLHPRLVESFIAEYSGKPLTTEGVIRAFEATQQGKTFARSLMPTSLHPLTFAVTAGESDAYGEAITELIAAAAKSLGATAGTDLASAYLRENSLSKLTGNIAPATVERLQGAIADAWDAGGSYNSIVKAITSEFEDFSEKRAGLIAQTEVNDAYSDARQQTAIDLGYDEKQWDPDGEACPECQENADAGWIPIDEEFPSGDDAPTAHPNCDCGCDYRMASGAEED